MELESNSEFYFWKDGNKISQPFTWEHEAHLAKDFNLLIWKENTDDIEA